MPYGGVTLQIHVGHLAAGLDFYTTLFGRGPDFSPHEDFFEWQVVAGAEVWWQIVVVLGQIRPMTNRSSLKVDDVRAATTWARTSLKVESSQVPTLPGVVSFVDFEDLWGISWGSTRTLQPMARNHRNRAAASVANRCSSPIRRRHHKQMVCWAGKVRQRKDGPMAGHRITKYFAARMSWIRGL